jgi:hypothetical protein
LGWQNGSSGRACLARVRLWVPILSKK